MRLPWAAGKTRHFQAEKYAVLQRLHGDRMAYRARLR
jgi:hypothetical protein